MGVHAAEPRTPEVVSAGHGNLSGHLIETKILHPAMDGIALNLDQYNPDPEINSHLEHLLHALHHRDYDRATFHAQAIGRLNLAEGNMLRIISGTADDAAAIERTVHRRLIGMSGNRLIAKLKNPLDRLLAGPDAEAARIVIDVVRANPKSMFQTKHVRKELGKARIAKLEQFLGGLQ